jgi:hypothetical protein
LGFNDFLVQSARLFFLKKTSYLILTQKSLAVIRHLLQRAWFAFEVARSSKMMHLPLVVPLVGQRLAFLAKIPRMHPRIYLGFIVAVIKQFLVLKRKIKLKSYLMLQIDH